MEITDKTFLKMDKRMITIFNLADNGAKRDRGDEVNIFMYICSHLGIAISNNPDITDFTLEIPYSKFGEILLEQPIQEERVTTNSLLQIVKKIENVSSIVRMYYDIPGKESMRNVLYDYTPVYQYIRISAKEYDYNEAVYEINLNPKFIEYYKEVYTRKDNYFKLKLDIMFSLSTRNSKIVYAYLSNYYDQMIKHNHQTNATLLEDLYFYLDSRKYKKDGKWVYKMSFDALKRIIKNALDDINKVIMMKREKYGVPIPLYEIEYIALDPNATRGPKTRITKFKFWFVDEDKEIEVEKYKKRENSYDPIINEFTDDAEIKALLQQFVAEAYERNNIASVNTFEKVLNNMKEANLTKEKTMEFIQDSITEGSPSIKFTKESHEKVKAFKEKAEKIQGRKERSFDDFNIDFDTSSRRRMDGRK